MDGYTATRLIRNAGFTMPISRPRYAMPIDREKALRSGCNEYLTRAGWQVVDASVFSAGHDARGCHRQRELRRHPHAMRRSIAQEPGDRGDLKRSPENTLGSPSTVSNMIQMLDSSGLQARSGSSTEGSRWWLDLQHHQESLVENIKEAMN
jgi:hypothetical protein